MKRLWLIGLIAAGMVIAPLGAPRTARADVAELQAVAPADCWGFVFIRQLGQFDGKLTQLGQAVNAPGAGMSALAMAKGMLGLPTGVNDNGSLAVLLLPAASAAEMVGSMVILVPTTAYADLLSLMEPEEVGDGVSKILFMEQETYVAQKGAFAVLGASADTVKKIVTSSGGLAGKLNPHQLERLNRDDLSIWVNAEAFMGSPMFANLTAMLQPMGFDTASLAPLRSLQLSLAVGPEGVTLGGYVDAKPGTPMAAGMAAVPAAGLLLAGLPAESYVLATGKSVSREEIGFGMEILDKVVGQLSADASGVNPEKLTELRGKLKAMLTPVRSSRFVVNAQPAEADGAMLVSLVLGFDGQAEGFIGALSEAVAVCKSGLLADPEHAEKLNAMLDLKAQAEPGISHLLFKPENCPDAPPDAVAHIQQFVGKEGLVFRMQVVGDKQVVITLGGGADYHGRVAALVKENKAPLQDDAGISKLAAGFPADRNVEAFASFGGAISLAKKLGAPLPAEIPAVPTPLAMVGQHVGGGQQVDVLVPMDLIKAAVLMGMGAMGPGPGGPPM